MQQVPATWPAHDAPSAVLPQVYAIFEDSAWPPASADCPAGTACVSSWSVDRSLTGGLLPGQARGATGMSIGRGSIEFPQPDHDTIAPWRGGSQTVPTGLLRLRLVAGHDGPSGPVVDLGRFQAAAREGSLFGPTIRLDLVEDTARMQTMARVPRIIDLTTLGTDAAWVIDQVARAAGYYSTPPPVPSCLSSWPLAGAPVPEVGTPPSYGQQQIPQWGSLDGQIGAAGALVGHPVVPIPSATTYYVTLTTTGTAQVIVREYSASSGGAVISIDPAGARFRIGTGAWVSYTPGLSSEHPARVTVRVTVTSHGPGTGMFNVAVSVKSAPSAPWSTGLSATLPIALTSYNVLVASDGLLSGVQITTVDDPNLWRPTTAQIAPSGTSLNAVLLTPTADAWRTVQEVAAATLGAAWLTETGVLTFRSSEMMQGVGAPVSEVLDVEDRLVDLTWVSDPADAADRVELSWVPPTITTTPDASQTVWEATEVTEVGPYSVVDVLADLDGTARDLAPWVSVPLAPGAPIPETGSVWVAGNAASGGTQVTTGITVTATMVDTGQVKITIQNANPFPVWMVDFSGSPLLILRANILARAGERQTISSGVDADVATNALKLDLGQWCQSASRADLLLAWITTQTESPRWRIERVTALTRIERQIGDVVVLRDRATGLDVRAMIIGISMSGGDGITQTLTLAVLED